MANVKVAVEFKAKADFKTLFYKGNAVKLDDDGKGELSVPPNQVEVILAELRGAQPGSAVEITLKANPPAKVDMVEFKSKVAKNRTVWANNRFFRVLQ